MLDNYKDEKSTIDLVFVSACYSEPIAKIFEEANFTAVICVHNQTKVLDEAAREFGRELYANLLEGNTIIESFKRAQNMVKNNVDIPPQNRGVQCCCYHTHKEKCEWKKMKSYNESPHLRHLKTCQCDYDNSHFHNIDCYWAKKFRKDFPVPKEYLDNLDELLKGNIPGYLIGNSDGYLKKAILGNKNAKNIITACCCSPEIAHNESMKFIAICSENSENKIKRRSFYYSPISNMKDKF